jgi:glucose dehydrogenase
VKLAWEYHRGDVSDGSDNHGKSDFEATPIVIDGTMYLSTPFDRVVALDPETDRAKWTFDPKIDLHTRYSEGLVSRGVSLWTDPGKAEGDTCRRPIFLATIDARLFALDAVSRQPCADFGAGGQMDLTHGIANIIRRGEYEETSAPAYELEQRRLRPGASDLCNQRQQPADRGAPDSARPLSRGRDHIQGRPFRRRGLAASTVRTPYSMSRELLRSPSRLPSNPPPSGSLVAVDLANGTIRWSETLGTTADLVPNLVPGIRGTPNLGAPIVTAGDVVFIGAAMDDYFGRSTSTRVRSCGRAGCQPLPMTYRVPPPASSSS